ncbi:polymorphic toxin-type HINT domain-containing protein [Roseimaritima multifibrata]|uniref:polymorphic toxin-type HINT domain-containing protein n=1 Tax=Roseimaritima multifibrata TaxID=1930274 RepID=UPI001C54F3C6|nr:polymorphic toxin-type HINT domain-containing protein [Roseimaritima multifibrata]
MLFLASGPFQNPALGAEPSRSLAEDILAAEADGDLESRSKLLQQLDAEASEEPLAQSLQGKVLGEDNLWRSVEESISANRKSSLLASYKTYRQTLPDTEAGNLQIANWCQKARLPEQEAAHLERTLLINPNNSIARLRLGHRYQSGTWVSPKEAARVQAEADILQKSLKKYGADIQKIRRNLESGNSRQVWEAMKQLDAIKDPMAIPAVAKVFQTAKSPASDEAILWLSNQEEPVVSRILAQWAVESRDPATRNFAGERLAARPMHEFVPQLLNQLESQIVSRVIPSFRADGSLAGVRHAFAKENADDIDVTVVDFVNARNIQDTIIRPDRSENATSAWRGRAFEREIAEQEIRLQNIETERKIRTQQAKEIAQREQRMAQSNVAIQNVNERIGYAMSQATGTHPGYSEKQLWDWWSDYTMREPPPRKYVSMHYSNKYSTTNFYSPPQFACECFVAGTLVTTSEGAKPIEQIRVGDQVLSKSIEDGTLSWDTVCATTEQPAKPLVRLQLEDEQLDCTQGHLFWVSGAGWTQARNLQNGDVLHAIADPIRIQDVSSAEAAPTYNLITNENHTYFVGETQVLSHDFNEQAPTAYIVPGLHYAKN